MSLDTMEDFTFKHTAQADNISGVYTAAQIKTYYDSRGVELRTFINELVGIFNSVTDGSSGADNVAMTAIAALGATATVQSTIEALVVKLQAVTDSSSGADFTGATAISGLTGGTVQAILEALKSYIDNHKTSTDHDSRYYTQSQLYTQSQVDALLLALIIGQLPDNSIATAKYQNGSVTADKCAADVATQAELDSLAGTGRTTETVKANADNIESHSNNTTTMHGATSAATASKVMIRDSSGRVKVAAPSAEDDVALKSNVTTVQGNIDTHLVDYANYQIGIIYGVVW